MKARLKRIVYHLLPRAISVHIYRWLAVRYIDNLSAEYDPAKKTLLLLNHFWDQDIRALFRANRDFNLIVVESPRLFKGAKIFFSEDVVGINAAYNAESLDNRLRYRDECCRIFDRLNRRYKLDLMVTANDNYYWVREFIAIAREHHVLTVMLDKEGFLTPYTFETEAERIRKLCPCICDHVYVWSERQKEYWRKVGVAGANINVIGQPRSDLFYSERRNDVDELFPAIGPLVTLFSYQDDVGIPISVLQHESLTWAEMKRQTHDEFHDLVREFPDHNFVIKTHPQQPDLAALQAKYRGKNIRVIGGSSTANELIQRSELIIAFQTTVILEAMFLDKRVIYTFWSTLAARFQDQIFPFHQAEGIVVADTFAKYRDVCRRFLDGNHGDFAFTDEQLKARDEFVNRYLYKPDGRVCKRFFASVDELLS